MFDLFSEPPINKLITGIMRPMINARMRNAILVDSKDARTAIAPKIEKIGKKSRADCEKGAGITNAIRENKPMPANASNERGCVGFFRMRNQIIIPAKARREKDKFCGNHKKTGWVPAG